MLRNKLKIDPEKAWATSDYHLFHAKVIEYDKRPFKDVFEMHEVIIDNHNSVVQPDDVVIYHGDLACNGSIEEVIKILKRLNGTFYFLRGNHDKLLLSGEFQKLYGARFTDVMVLKYGRESIFCSHYKHLVWPKSHKGALHTFGHSHGNLESMYMQDRSMDVGIMTNDYYPYKYANIIELLEKKPIKCVDHHGSKN